MIDAYLPTVPHTAFCLTCSEVNKAIGSRPPVPAIVRLTIATHSYPWPLPTSLRRCGPLCSHPKADVECLECGQRARLCAGHAEPLDVLWAVTIQEAIAAMIADPTTTPPRPARQWWEVSTLGEEGWKVICLGCRVRFARLALRI